MLLEASLDQASARRKACDLCFTKKIKCDMLKPVCSNCILYNSECRTTSAARRKANTSRPRQSGKAQSEIQEENEDLKARLARIERQLQDILEGTKEQHAQASSNSSSDERSRSQGSVGTSSASQPWKFDPVEPRLYHGPADQGLALPPIDNILPVIDHFFNTFNQVLPLFDQDHFMRLLTGWYNHTTTRDKATWAAILMVCAMGLRSPVPGDRTCSQDAEKNEWANYCMRNAQSVMSELVTREEDLLGIQVLLSLVLLFHNSSDARPASVLIGTAVRLAHRLQLHSSNSAKFFPADDAQQRARVFWIAYTLDKDICLRTKSPAAQSDNDIDIPLPPLNPPDGVGLIWTKDGRSQFNIWRMRIDLAHIQGKVYELLYANRSPKAKGAERQRRVASLEAMLAQWYNRVPMAFRIEHASATVSDSELVQLVKMHHAYLHAIVHTHGIYSHDAEWVKWVSSLNKASTRDFALGMQGASPICSTDLQNPPMTEGWNHCVEVSRGCIKLFQDATPTECLIWQCSCAHFSGLIILLANVILFPTRQGVALDQQIANRAVQLFESLVYVVSSEGFKALQHIISDLHKGANTAVNEARAQDAIVDGGVLGDGAGDLFAQDIGLPSFVGADDEDLPGSLDMEGMFDQFFVQDGPRLSFGDIDSAAFPT